VARIILLLAASRAAEAVLEGSLSATLSIALLHAGGAAKVVLEGSLSAALSIAVLHAGGAAKVVFEGRGAAALVSRGAGWAVHLATGTMVVVAGVGFLGLLKLFKLLLQLMLLCFHRRDTGVLVSMTMRLLLSSSSFLMGVGVDLFSVMLRFGGSFGLFELSLSFCLLFDFSLLVLDLGLGDSLLGLFLAGSLDFGGLFVITFFLESLGLLLLLSNLSLRLGLDSLVDVATLGSNLGLLLQLSFCVAFCATLGDRSFKLFLFFLGLGLLNFILDVDFLGGLRCLALVEVLDGLADGGLARVGSELATQLLLHLLAHFFLKRHHFGVKGRVGILEGLLVVGTSLLQIRFLLFEVLAHLLDMRHALLHAWGGHSIALRGRSCGGIGYLGLTTFFAVEALVDFLL